jgi:hypothetical protein
MTRSIPHLSWLPDAESRLAALAAQAACPETPRMRSSAATLVRRQHVTIYLVKDSDAVI